MGRQFDIDIVAHDKASRVADQVRDRLQRFNAPLETINKRAGVFGKTAVLETFTKRMGGVASVGGDVAFSFMRMAGGAGAAGGALAATAGIAVGAVGALALGAQQAARLSFAWSKAGVDIGKTSRLLGVSTSALQSWRGAARYAGVDASALDGAMANLGQTAQDALMGRNQEALVLAQRLGIQFRRNKDGSIDTADAMVQLAGAMDKYKTAQQRALIAGAFGVEGALPLLNQGRDEVLRGLRDFNRSFKRLSDEDIAQQEAYHRRVLALQDRWDALKQRMIRRLVLPVGEGAVGIAEWLLGGGQPRDAAPDNGGGRGGGRRRAGAPAGPGSSAGINEDRVRAFFAGRGRVPIGIRNRNPGNLRPVGSSTGFQTFPTHEAGLAKMAWQLRRYKNVHGLDTIQGIINRWAPASENDVAAYVANVVKQTGFGARERLNLNDPATLARLQKAMISHENGGSPYSYDQILTAIGGRPAPTPPAAPAGPQRVQVDVNLNNAPPGSTARVSQGSKDRAAVRVDRSLPATMAGYGTD